MPKAWFQAMLFEERIDEADQQEGGGELWTKARTLGDAAGDDGRDCGGEGEQEEELGQFETAFLHQGLGTGEEVHPVGDAVADEEIGDGRDREIAEDLDQGIDLVLAPHRAQFEEGKAGVHRQDHDGTEQDEQDVAGCLEILHCGAPKARKARMGGTKASEHSRSLRYLKSVCWMKAALTRHLNGAGTISQCTETGSIFKSRRWRDGVSCVSFQVVRSRAAAAPTCGPAGASSRPGCRPRRRCPNRSRPAPRRGWRHPCPGRAPGE
jgi:hypothetical protein